MGKIKEFIDEKNYHEFYISKSDIINGIDFSRIYTNGSTENIELLLKNNLVRLKYLLLFVTKNPNFKYFTANLYISNYLNFYSDKILQYLIDNRLIERLLLFRRLNLLNLDDFEKVSFKSIYEYDDVNMFSFLQIYYYNMNLEHTLNLACQYKSRNILNYISINLNPEYININFEYDISIYDYASNYCKFEPYDITLLFDNLSNSDNSDIVRNSDNSDIVRNIRFLINNDAIGKKLNIAEYYRILPKLEDNMQEFIPYIFDKKVPLDFKEKIIDTELFEILVELRFQFEI